MRDLEELGKAIRYENKGIEHAVCEASEQIGMLVKELGVKLDENDVLSPGSIAEYITTEYDDVVKEITEKTELLD